MEIKFISDDKLLLNKTIEIHSMIIVIRAVFHEDNKYFSQFFWDECLYRLWSNIKMVYYDGLKVSERIDANKTSKKECNICHYWYFLKKDLSFNHMSAMDAMIYWWCLWTLVNLMQLFLKSSDCRYIISGINESEAINLMQNIDLTKKSRTL